MNKHQHEPYEALGLKLKHLRKQWQQSVKEVSGTLEIQEKTLRAIEAGKTVPSEGLLELFINHFLLTDQQADDLRELADHYKEQASEGLANGIEDMLMKQVMMYMPNDMKTFYTDGMQATVNKNGVVLQFMQSGTEHGQVPVSRLGMSHEHAERMISVLRATLEQHKKAQGSKTLPSPKEDNQV